MTEPVTKWHIPEASRIASLLSGLPAPPALESYGIEHGGLSELGSLLGPGAPEPVTPRAITPAPTTTAPATPPPSPPAAVFAPPVAAARPLPPPQPAIIGTVESWFPSGDSPSVTAAEPSLWFADEPAPAPAARPVEAAPRSATAAVAQPVGQFLRQLNWKNEPRQVPAPVAAEANGRAVPPAAQGVRDFLRGMNWKNDPNVRKAAPAPLAVSSTWAAMQVERVMDTFVWD